MGNELMRNIILDLAATLDGYIEGPNGEIDWCIMDDDMDFGSFLAGIDTIFYGRVSYEMSLTYKPADATPELLAMLEEIDRKQKYVFSHKGITDDHVTIISNDIAERVAAIKQQPGKDIWLYGGASIIKTFIDLNLIDYYRIALHPVALGGGKPLFENLSRRVELKLIETKTFSSGVVQLVYRAVK